MTESVHPEGNLTGGLGGCFAVNNGTAVQGGYIHCISLLIINPFDGPVVSHKVYPVGKELELVDITGGNEKGNGLCLQILEHPGKLRRLKKGKRNVIQDNQLCAKNVGLQDFHQILLCLCQVAHFFLGGYGQPQFTHPVQGFMQYEFSVYKVCAVFVSSYHENILHDSKGRNQGTVLLYQCSTGREYAVGCRIFLIVEFSFRGGCLSGENQ